MQKPEHQLKFWGQASTDTGMLRKNNEDNIFIWGEDASLFASVADGMGGAVAGEEASRLAVETIQRILTDDGRMTPEHYKQLDEETILERLLQAITQANIRIVYEAIRKPELKGMGTTMTLVCLTGDKAIIAHVGDSRAYRVDGTTHEIEQLTIDHSFVQALIDAGHISEEEAEYHPMRNVLYRALGQSEELDIDAYMNITFYTGDRLIVCSDGLTLHLRNSDIAEIAMKYDDPEQINQAMIDLANARGGRDNISVVSVIASRPDPHLATSLPEIDTQEEIETAPMDTHHQDDLNNYNGYGGEGMDNEPLQ